MDRMYNIVAQSVPSSSQNAPNGSQESHGSDDDSRERKTRMEQSLNRSITLVFWYKPKCDPIRLHHEVPTFPLFQLSHFPSLVADLGLSPTSYIDAYNPVAGHWEQHVITSVRVVDRDQRLLYKVRKSLMEGLSDDECPGLHHEVVSQPKIVSKPAAQFSMSLNANGNLKRSAEEAPEPTPPNKYLISDAYSGQQSYGYTSQAYPQSLSAPTPTPMPTNGAAGPPNTPPQDPPPASPKRTSYLYQGSHLYTPGPSVTLPAHLTAPQTAAVPIPYHPHPPLKRWPNDYTVSEIATGFRQMDGLIVQTPSVTQRTAFERVFGCRYVKSTVCRHRGVWRRADATLREHFEALGSDEHAVWGEFVRRVEGRPPGKAGMGGEDGLGHVFVGERSGHEEEEEADQTVMTPLRQPSNMGIGQVSVTSASQMSAMHSGGHLNVYDPALTAAGQTLQT